MNWRLIGLVGSVGAFFVVAIFISQLIASGFLETVVPGVIAGYFVFQYCIDREMKELKETLNPPEETWPVPLPIAWGTIKDVLDTAKVTTGTSGTCGWKVQKEDDSRGLIIALLQWNEQVGGMSGQILVRTVELTANLTPEGSSTKVKTEYKVFSPMNFNAVRQVVMQTQSQLTADAARNAQQQEGLIG